MSLFVKEEWENLDELNRYLENRCKNNWAINKKIAKKTEIFKLIEEYDKKVVICDTILKVSSLLLFMWFIGLFRVYTSTDEMLITEHIFAVVVVTVLLLLSCVLSWIFLIKKRKALLILEKFYEREIKSMNNQEVVKELFNDIKVFKGESQVTSEDVDKRALKQWTEKHDRIPTIDDIDLVIKEVRNER